MQLSIYAFMQKLKYKYYFNIVQQARGYVKYKFIC